MVRFVLYLTEDPNDKNITVTASKGVYTNDILAAVFGLSIKYDSLYQMLNFTTSFCPKYTNCENISCYEQVGAVTSPFSSILLEHHSRNDIFYVINFFVRLEPSISAKVYASC